MSNSSVLPRSPLDELDGLLYFRRLCDKVRLMEAGTLDPDFHANLGKAMDLWMCQFLGVGYEDLKSQILSGATDEDALAWARENGVTRPDYEKEWFLSYLRNFGFRDHMSERLAGRKKEAPHTDRDDILTFLDYIEVDEGRSL